MRHLRIAGYKIDADQERMHTPAQVTLHRLGGDTGFFTPAEARALARMLVEAADFAESD